MLEAIVNDVRAAVRSLSRTRGFTVLAVLALALVANRQPVREDNLSCLSCRLI
jgi:hypothetical protein